MNVPEVFKWAIPGLFSLFIFAFSSDNFKCVYYKIYANDWIRTADLWNRKRSLDLTVEELDAVTR